MRLDPTVALVMTLFTLMVGATSVSAVFGYTLGRKALSGVTQPDISRSNQSNASPNAESADGYSMLKSEDEILSAVAEKIKAQTAQPALPNRQSDASGEQSQGLKSEAGDTILASNSDVSFVNYQSSLPLLAENQDVIMAVNAVRRQGNVLRISLSLQNVGDRPVEFLYSLIDVIDQQGQPLSVSTDGLPQEIPPTGQTFEGSVTIPVVLLGTSDTLSLRLTDYPDQDIELSISDIPVAQ